MNSGAAAAEATTRRSYLDAIRIAQAEEMRRDPRVIVMGQDVEHNVYGTYTNYIEEFGPERVRDLPISELGFTGMAIGAAMTGLRPIVDFTVSTFMLVAMEQILSQAAKARYMYGGQTSVPVVLRGTLYYNASIAAHHADRPHSIFMAIPGLKIVAPSSPRDMRGLLKAAIRDPDPVLCFEAVPLWTTREEVPDEEYLIPIGEAAVKRAGDDVTVVAVGPMVPLALRAADELADAGVAVEVVDVRSLVPLDWETIERSVRRTGRLVVADVGQMTCGAASEIAAHVAETCHGELRAAPRRVASPDVHVPFSPVLEQALYPTVESIVGAVREVVGR